MRLLNKGLSFLVVVLLAVSTVMAVAPTVSAQSIPKPSVPQFTLKFVNSSYLVPETPYYQTDPYTGKQKYIGMQGGYLSKNYTIEISVKGHSFLSSINDTTLQLYYNVQAKGLYENNWSNLNLWSDDQIDTNYLPIQENSEYTIISTPANTYTPGGTVQFEVRAILGGYFPVKLDYYPYYGAYFGYEASDWSSTQSITIPSGGSIAAPTAYPTSTPFSTSYNPNPTAASSINSSPPQENTSVPLTTFMLTTIAFIVVIAGLLLLLYRRRYYRRKEL